MLQEHHRHTDLLGMNTCKNHQYKEHAIGAGLTRKVCVLCGIVHIGQRSFSIGVDPWHVEASTEIDLTTEPAEAVA